jgi:RHS repeat-associated protein
VVNNMPEGWFQGEIAEVLIYNRALSPEEQTQVEVYLTSRHALPSQTASLDLSSDFRYTGHYYHRKSGLHLAPYRAYDAEMAVWLSEDPIQEEGGINLYGYVGGSPVMAVDPLGLVDWCPGAEPYKADLLKTQFGRDLLAALQAAEKRAKQTITVQTHDAPSKFYQGTNVIALSNNAESYPTAGGSPVLFQPGQLLAHEMKHAFDHLNGELGKFILDKKGPFPPYKSCPNRAEFRAMETENVWIQSLNELNKNLKGWNPLPLRGYY